MWAGGAHEFFAPIHVDDVVTRRSTIADVQQKSGRSGTLCFVVVEHEVRTQRGVAIRERQDIVYREAVALGDRSAAKVAEAHQELQPDQARPIHPDPILLFRYSALTFNGHRIHYDLPYATEVEGYAGLVVHGPLQASLLMNAVAEVGGKTPGRFAYRGARPWILGGAGQIYTASVGPSLV